MSVLAPFLSPPETTNPKPVPLPLVQRVRAFRAAPTTPVRCALAQALHAHGLSAGDIAYELDIRPRSLRHLLQLCGLPDRAPGEAHHHRREPR